MSPPPSQADSECKCDTYQYWIYAGLGALVFISESLGITKKVQSNSIVQALTNIVKTLLPKTAVAPDEQAQLQQQQQPNV